MSLKNLTAYEEFIYTLQEQYPAVQMSTLVLVRMGNTIAVVRGQLTFAGDVRLIIKEALSFKHGAGQITEYGYEIWRGDGKLYWYDSQEHPNDPTLASTHPHHKHIPPNIKHNRIPAPELRFTEPNLPFLIAEIERELAGKP
jgi:hypothetical protein